MRLVTRTVHNSIDLLLLIAVSITLGTTGCSYDFGQDGKFFRCTDDGECRDGYKCVTVEGQLACVPIEQADSFGLDTSDADATDTASPDTTAADTDPSDTSGRDTPPSDTTEPDTGGEDTGDTPDTSDPDAGDTTSCAEPCTPGCTPDGRHKIVCDGPGPEGCFQPREIPCGGTEYCDSATNDCEACGSEHCDLFADASCAAPDSSGYSTAIEGCFPDASGCGVEQEENSCSNGVCASPGGQTQCLTHECDGDGCDGDTPFDCVVDQTTGQRQRDFRATCPTRTFCQTTAGSSQCQCQHQCNIGEERCNGAVYQYCDRDGNGCRYWVSQTDCENADFNATLGCNNGVVKCTHGPSNSCLKKTTETCPSGQQCMRFGAGNYGCG